MYRINSYLSSVDVDGIFCRIRRKSVVGKFCKSEIEYKATYKRNIQKLDVYAFREKDKRFKSQIHLIIISRDC